MNLDGCVALITGASAGLGREFAIQLASKARILVLVARRADRLAKLRDEITAQRPEVRVQIRAVDLSSSTEVSDLTNWLGQQNLEPDFLVNNAGLGDLGPFHTAAPDRLDQVIRVNVLSLTLLTRALLPPMIARNRGAILNVSSSAGFLPIPGFAVYAATKAFVTSFSEGLRSELRTHCITVSALCPGPIHTEFTAVAYRPGAQPQSAPEFVHVSPQRVVRAGLRAIERNQALVIPGLVIKTAMFFTRITPMPLLRLAGRLRRVE
jgi:short-subunit dehydrogenase